MGNRKSFSSTHYKIEEYTDRHTDREDVASSGIPERKWKWAL
jgi:hypothetical protein